MKVTIQKHSHCNSCLTSSRSKGPATLCIRSLTGFLSFNASFVELIITSHFNLVISPSLKKHWIHLTQKATTVDTFVFSRHFRKKYGNFNLWRDGFLFVLEQSMATLGLRKVVFYIVLERNMQFLQFVDWFSRIFRI